MQAEKKNQFDYRGIIVGIQKNRWAAIMFIRSTDQLHNRHKTAQNAAAAGHGENTVKKPDTHDRTNIKHGDQKQTEHAPRQKPRKVLPDGGAENPKSAESSQAESVGNVAQQGRQPAGTGQISADAGSRADGKGLRYKNACGKQQYDALVAAILFYFPAEPIFNRDNGITPPLNPEYFITEHTRTKDELF